MTGNSPEICLLCFHTSTSGRHIGFVQGIREVKEGFMPHRYALVICACTSPSGDVVIQQKNTELKRVYRGKRGGDKAAPKKNFRNLKFSLLSTESRQKADFTDKTKCWRWCEGEVCVCV